MQKYAQILEVLQWIGVDPDLLLFGVDHVQREIAYINDIHTKKYEAASFTKKKVRSSSFKEKIERANKILSQSGST